MCFLFVVFLSYCTNELQPNNNNNNNNNKDSDD